VAQSALLASVIDGLGELHAGTYAGITAHSPRPCVVEGAKLARNAAPAGLP
jgi:maleylacetate reductase